MMQKGFLLILLCSWVINFAFAHEDQIRSQVRVIDLADDDLDMLKRVVDNAKKYYANRKEYDQAWQLESDDLHSIVKGICLLSKMGKSCMGMVRKSPISTHELVRLNSSMDHRFQMYCLIVITLEYC
jgi:hypothetical protein